MKENLLNNSLALRTQHFELLATGRQADMVAGGLAVLFVLIGIAAVARAAN